jgi:hypothetical protein
MTDRPSVRSPFAEAAARFDRVVQEVKERQLARTGARMVVPEATLALHPEEAWARSFATHAIRPRRGAGGPPLSGFVAPPADVPKTPVFPVAPPRKTPESHAAPPGGQSGNHIGAQLGKPGPRRSWLGRLFRGPSRGI